MRFYRLTHPEYETDRDEDRANPIHPVRDVWLPGVICPTCGETWAGSRRLYLPITDPALRKRLRSAPLPLTEWLELIKEVRTHLRYADDFRFVPGDVLGQPRAELLSSDLPDLLHPFPGQLIVGSQVVEVLQRTAATGVQLVVIEVQWSKELSVELKEPTDLYELLVTGTAARVGKSGYQGLTCQDCHRRVFPNPDYLAVDESRWDGSDFFHVDDNPNIVLVTERIRELFADNRFTNYACIPVS